MTYADAKDLQRLAQRVEELEREFSRFEAWARMHHSFHTMNPTPRPKLNTPTDDKIERLRYTWNRYCFKKDEVTLENLSEAVLAICGRRT